MLQNQTTSDLLRKRRTATICRIFPTTGCGNPLLHSTGALGQAVSMTYPRSHLISEEEPGFYHCVSRCRPGAAPNLVLRYDGRSTF